MKEKLALLALAARENAYAPYSQFKVGAAILCESGKTYTGANVENISYGMTNCAERSAIFSAVSAGEKKVLAIAVAGGKDKTDWCMPCGACRQVLSEFADKDCPVYLVKSETEIREYTLAELLPYAFGEGEKKYDLFYR